MSTNEILVYLSQHRATKALNSLRFSLAQSMKIDEDSYQSVDFYPRQIPQYGRVLDTFVHMR